MLAPRFVAIDVHALVREHGKYVWRVLRHLGIAASDLDDEAQEVFLVAHRKKEALEQVQNVRGWLFEVCVRRAMQWRRTRARRPVASSAEVPEEAVEARGEDALRARDEQKALAWILDHLDEDKRTVFVLHDIEELPMKDITTMLGVPLQTGYSRLRAAREIVAAAAARAKARQAL